MLHFFSVWLMDPQELCRRVRVFFGRLESGEARCALRAIWATEVGAARLVFDRSLLLSLILAYLLVSVSFVDVDGLFGCPRHVQEIVCSFWGRVRPPTKYFRVPPALSACPAVCSVPAVCVMESESRAHRPACRIKRYSTLHFVVV